ncbi:putative pentatricopeptide repeat-containing protein At1g53330 [Diospyros lotus]|uniref:putative pentatricopeptide repeat-containing protein At1g53330 n=1 Tax=Diospyros lotus TaxID=55363 RepID=UPI0022575F74|nr:putative pentatricopeptide repeat-containing protein At1g53330 [Diospyros lotus]
MEKLRKLSPFRLDSLLRLQKDPKLALQIFLNPNERSVPNPKPFRYSLRSYDIIITKLGGAKMFDEMERVVQKLKQETRFVPKEIIFCNVITFYGRARLPNLALRTFDQMPSFGCQRTVKSVNTLLNALLACREFEKMGEVFVGIEEHAAPDACTYNILINACCRCNDLGGAWNVFDEMLKKRIRPNVVTFGTLINGLCVNFKLSEALRLKEDMERVFRVKPNGFVYSSLIKGLCKADELNLAFKVKDEMLKRRLEFDLSVYPSLISALFKVGRKGDVNGLLEEIKQNGCKPDIMTYNAMIYGFCQDENFDAAFGILSEMENKGCKPDIISYNVIIGGLCRVRNLTEANDLFEDMPRRKCAPDVVTYRILFDGLHDGMQLKEASLILDEMIFKGYSPHAASVMRFVDRVCQGDNLKLMRTVLNSLGSGNLIDADTWRMVVPVVCKIDRLSIAYKLVDTLVIQ